MIRTIFLKGSDVCLCFHICGALLLRLVLPLIWGTWLRWRCVYLSLTVTFHFSLNNAGSGLTRPEAVVGVDLLGRPWAFRTFANIGECSCFGLLGIVIIFSWRNCAWIKESPFVSSVRVKIWSCSSFLPNLILKLAVKSNFDTALWRGFFIRSKSHIVLIVELLCASKWITHMVHLVARVITRSFVGFSSLTILCSVEEWILWRCLQELNGSFSSGRGAWIHEILSLHFPITHTFFAENRTIYLERLDA